MHACSWSSTCTKQRPHAKLRAAAPVSAAAAATAAASDFAVLRLLRWQQHLLLLLQQWVHRIWWGGLGVGNRHRFKYPEYIPNSY